jgi:hypothetical protein
MNPNTFRSHARRHVVHRQQITRRNRAGVVHQDVDLARLAGDLAHRLVGREIGGNHPHVHLPPCPNPRGRRLQHRRIARHQDHVAALVGQDLGCRAPDPLRPAGDQSPLARQFQIHFMPPSG